MSKYPFSQLIRTNLSQLLDLGVKLDRYPASDRTDGDEQIGLTSLGDATMVATSVTPYNRSQATNCFVASRLPTQGRSLQLRMEGN